MRGEQFGGIMCAEQTSNNALHRPKLGTLLHSEPKYFSANNSDDDNKQNNNNHVDYSRRDSASPAMSPGFYDPYSVSVGTSPSPNYMTSPWNNQKSPFNKSPWILPTVFNSFDDVFPSDGLIGSLVREEGHIYSLAVSGDLLYTGSDSKNIRVWKNLKEFTGFKSSSGLVKAIVILRDLIFTGHQDGKIRIWKISSKKITQHKRIGSLPSFKDYVKSSMNPKNYVVVRRNKKAVRVKHYDAVSCMSLNEEQGLLYSGSWDKTVKVWRIATLKCLESINAHDDAVNSVVSGFNSFVFTGSADGTVKVWRRELHGKLTKHCLAQVLLKQENAITALAVNKEADVLYCGSSDGLLNFWERQKHLSHGGVLRGHRLAILCLATSGNLVLSGSADKNICLWRREEGRVHTCLSVLTGHTGPVKCLAIEEDRQCDRTKEDRRWIVYSGSLDRSVKVWRVSEYVPEFKQMNPVKEPCASSVYASPNGSVIGELSFSSIEGANSMNQRQETPTRVYGLDKESKINVRFEEDGFCNVKSNIK